MLILVGLQTLFQKLVDTRTFAERMFDVITLTKLDIASSREAITKPIENNKCPVNFTTASIEMIIDTSRGYFIQFICREIYDVFLQKINADEKPCGVPMDEITRKLDKDFFAGRWSRATNRQRELLSVIATLDNCDGEFTIQQIVAQAKIMPKPFDGSQVNQMLGHLTDSGLIYKNRHGKYSFAVPLLGRFILRQDQEANL